MAVVCVALITNLASAVDFDSAVPVVNEVLANEGGKETGKFLLNKLLKAATLHLL